MKRPTPFIGTRPTAPLVGRRRDPRPGWRSIMSPKQSDDMQIHTRTGINCSALHLWIVLRRIEYFERWNPFVTIKRLSSARNAILYSFTNDPRSGLRAVFNGTLAVDDPSMTLTLRFGTRHFRFTETLQIERTPDRQWLHHDLYGEGLGVKLLGGILARRLRPKMLHANAMLDRFVTPSRIPTRSQPGDNFLMRGARLEPNRPNGSMDRRYARGDDPCPKA